MEAISKEYSTPQASGQQFTGWLEILLGIILFQVSPVLANSNSQPQFTVCNDAP